MSKLVIAARKQGRTFTGVNGTVFEYAASDGSLKTIVTFSERGVGHSERLLAKDIEALGVQPSQVTRIYSELEPCELPWAHCNAFIQRVFPQADVTWSFDYGDAASRAKGKQELLNAVKALQ